PESLQSADPEQHDDQPHPGQGHAHFVHPGGQFKQLCHAHFCISGSSHQRRVVSSPAAMIHVSEPATARRMAACPEDMDRLLPPRIVVSNSRKKVGEYPVAFLNRRLKYSSSLKPSSREISFTGLSVWSNCHLAWMRIRLRIRSVGVVPRCSRTILPNVFAVT